jgi:PAS domain S-box-containing protein
MTDTPTTIGLERPRHPARAEAELKLSESLLVEAQEIAHIGSWNWELATNLIYWSDEHFRIVGLRPQEVPMTVERAASYIHPDDRPAAWAAVNQSLRDLRPYEWRLRIVREGGEVRVAQSRGRLVCDERGKPVRMVGTLQDVTERVRAEQALQESEERISTLVALMPAAVYTCDAAGRITFYNRRAAELWGREPRLGEEQERFCGSFRMWTPDGLPLMHDQCPMAQAVREGRAARNMEVVIERPAGSRVVASVNIDPLYDREGRLAGGINVFVDVTERKRAEEALRVANERLDLAMRGSNIGIWDVDLAPGSDYRRDPVRFVNVWEQLGYDPADFPTDAVASRALGHPDDLPRVDAAVASCLAGEAEEIRVENRIRRKDGSWHWLLTLGKAIRDPSGTPVRLIGTVQDINERKRVEEALRASEERLAADLASTTRLQELSTRFVQAGDLHLLLEEIIAAAAELTGTNKGNIQLVDPSGALRMVVHHGHGPRFVGHFALRGREASCEAALRLARRVIVEDVTREVALEGTTDLEVILDDGIRAIQSTPLVSRDGRLLGMLSNHFPVPHRPPDRDLRLLDLLARMAADYIERSQAEDALRQAKEAAEQANRVKDEFLATLSHELRTPLAAVLLWANMLADGMVQEKDHDKAVRAIVAGAEAQGQLIDDLLDVSRLISGTMWVGAREVELAPVVTAAVEAVRPMAQVKGVRVDADTGAAAAAVVLGDAPRLRQVLWNLLINAVKFTPGGGQVEVRLEAAGEVVRVAVRDTGEGISPDFLPHVFERFRQADPGLTRAHGGLGLGLAIVRELVQLHGGAVRADSAGAGRGSTFTVELPLARPSMERGPSDSTHGSGEGRAGQLEGVRVLLVDDDAAMRTAVQWMLEQSRAEVTAVGSASEALVAFRQSVAGRRFDVLLSDIGMPGRDGYDLLREIREAEGAEAEAAAVPAAPLPAAALTAYAREDDRARATAAGFQAHVPKPVHPGALVAAVADLAGRGWPAGSEIPNPIQQIPNNL